MATAMPGNGYVRHALIDAEVLERAGAEWPPGRVGHRLLPDVQLARQVLTPGKTKVVFNCFGVAISLV